MRAAVAWGLVASAAACTPAARPYRFASPMLAAADTELAAPAGALRAARAEPRPAPASPPRDARPPRVHAASAEAASAVGAPPAWASLPAPHRSPAGEERPGPRVATDLRALVGRRTKAAPLAVALAWQAAITGAPVPDVTDGPSLVAVVGDHAAAPTELAAPGDLLVFDRTEGDGAADLVAVAIARDPRGVTEFAYVAGGLVRRGFLDASRPAIRRDAAGATVNTFLRAGKRWPPAGTHYLAGELLAHVIRR